MKALGLLIMALQRFALVSPMRPSAMDKKSFSIVSRPVLA